MKQFHSSFLLFLFFLISQANFAQEGATIELTLPGLEKETPTYDIPLIEVRPFLSYSVMWEDPAVALEIRFGKAGKMEAEWQSLLPDPHANPAVYNVISQLQFTDADVDQFQLRWEGGSPGVIYLNFYSPGETKEALVPSDPVKSFSCPCPQPGIVGRADWCPDGNCPEGSDPAVTDVTHLIVHHSAGTNTSNDWAAVVRSIWNFHVNVNNWDDIGYNWLIDPDGLIYEGRGDDIRGAHFCGTNGNTMGACVLGDFTSITPTDDAIGSLQDLLSWKACDVNVDPLGSGFHTSSGLNLNHISGHQDGCATACPGDSFYPLLPNIRLAVADYIENSCDGLPGPTELDLDEQTENSVILIWTDNSSNETGFEIERSPGGAGSFVLLATLPANTTTYEDATVESGESYFYRVRAIRDEIPSEYSNIEVVFFVTSTQDQVIRSGINLRPNPAGSLVELIMTTSLVGDYDLSIVDGATGRLIKTRSVTKGQADLIVPISLTGLNAGIYFVKVRHEEGIATIRLVKE